MYLPSKEISFFLFLLVFIPVQPQTGYAGDNQSLTNQLHEKSQRDQANLKRVQSYQKTQIRLLDSQRIQNQKAIADTNRKLQVQSQTQRAKLDELKWKVDDLKRRQSYYSRVKSWNNLRNHSFNTGRNRYK